MLWCVMWESEWGHLRLAHLGNHNRYYSNHRFSHPLNLAKQTVTVSSPSLTAFQTKSTRTTSGKGESIAKRISAGSATWPRHHLHRCTLSPTSFTPSFASALPSAAIVFPDPCPKSATSMARPRTVSPIPSNERADRQEKNQTKATGNCRGGSLYRE